MAMTTLPCPGEIPGAGEAAAFRDARQAQTGMQQPLHQPQAGGEDGILGRHAVTIAEDPVGLGPGQAAGVDEILDRHAAMQIGPQAGEHALQVAWREIDVPQCGFCQPGQIMQAAGLLQRTPKPTDQEIDTAMNGHICRCGTYPRIRAAIKAAAEKNS